MIEVRERIPAPQVENDTTPRNILASQDGTILSLKVYEGEAAVKKGEAVLKGDLLISSVVTNKDLSVSFKHARGVAIAQTRHTVSHTFLSGKRHDNIPEWKASVIGFPFLGCGFLLASTGSRKGRQRAFSFVIRCA